MIRYHTFDTIEKANEFLAQLRANGGLGYALTYNATHHEVREIV